LLPTQSKDLRLPFVSALGHNARRSSLNLHVDTTQCPEPEFRIIMTGHSERSLPRFVRQTESKACPERRLRGNRSRMGTCICISTNLRRTTRAAHPYFPQCGIPTWRKRGPHFLRKSGFTQIVLFGCTFLCSGLRPKPLLQSRQGCEFL
jgi:hypothetical protein